MTAPLVQTPIQLAAYSRPRSAAQLPTNVRSEVNAAHVAVGDVVRISPHMRHRRDLVVTVEQGVAAVLLDLQSQSPLQTHTIAPSDRVTAPPLVIERRMPSGLERTTLLAMASGPVLNAHLSRLDSRERVVSEEITTIPLPAEVLALFPLPSGEALALTKNEALIISSTVTYRAGIASGKRLDTSMLDACEAREILADTDGARLPDLAAALCIVTQTSTLSCHIVAVYNRGERISVFGGIVDGLPNAAACSVRGAHIAALDNNELVSARLAVRASGVAALDVRRVQLGAGRPANILLATPSHLLMVALLGETHGKERAAALVWDIDYDAVLAQVEWSLSPGTGMPQVSVAPAGPEQAVVQIDTIGDRGRTSVLVLPLSVPSTGLLRHAVGAAAQTAPWLGNPAPAELVSLSEQQLLDTLGEAADASAIDAAFRAWVDEETERVRAVVGARKARPEFGPALVAQVLDAALPTGDGKEYARETVRYLLERGAVSTAMRGAAGDALVRRILDTRDWTVLQLVLRHVSDVSESHAVGILRDAFNDANAPPVARVLAHVLAPPSFSKPQMRLALRRTISSENQVLVLLDISRAWLDTLLGEPLQGAQRNRSDDHEVEVGDTGITYMASDVTPPPLDAVISFTEDLLDTYFPQLLAMPTCHAYLGETTRALTQHVSALQMLSRLRGPLDAFAHQADAAKKGGKDSRSRRLALYEASLVVPQYSVDQLEV